MRLGLPLFASCVLCLCLSLIVLPTSVFYISLCLVLHSCLSDLSMSLVWSLCIFHRFFSSPLASCTSTLPKFSLISPVASVCYFSFSLFSVSLSQFYFCSPFHTPKFLSSGLGLLFSWSQSLSFLIVLSLSHAMCSL